MARRAYLLATLAVALALPRPASAVDIKVGKESLRLDITESLWLAYHADNGNSYFNPAVTEYTGLDGKRHPCSPSLRLPQCFVGDVTDDAYTELLNRLNVQLAWRRFLVSARFDSGFWGGTPSAEALAQVPMGEHRFVQPGFSATRGPVPTGVAAFNVEKLSLSYLGRDVELTLGDFYANLGRGLILSIRKIDELGVDTTITGAKLLVHKGDVAATALAGFTNHQNFDQTRAQWIDESNDLLVGGNLSYRILKRATVGANVLFGAPGCPTGQKCKSDVFNPVYVGQNYVLRPGLMLDAPRLLPWLGLYVEYARRQDAPKSAPAGPIVGDNKRVEGDALYIAADFFLGAITVQLEGKYYDNYQPWYATAKGGLSNPFGNLQYMAPPTLERIIVQMNNNTDIIAGRARVGTRLGKNASVYASGQLGQSKPDVGSVDTLVDLVVGGEFRWDQGRSHFFPLLEYRNEHQDSNRRYFQTGYVAPITEEQLVAVEWDFSQDLPRRLSLESNGLIWFRYKPIAFADGWVEGQTYLKLAWASKLAVAVGYEFTSATDQKSFTHDFVNGQLKWNITPGTSLVATGGGYRGGLKCVSGVCRVFPPFQGAMLELVVRL